MFAYICVAQAFSLSYTIGMFEHTFVGDNVASVAAEVHCTELAMVCSLLLRSGGSITVRSSWGNDTPQALMILLKGSRTPKKHTSRLCTADTHSCALEKRFIGTDWHERVLLSRTILQLLKMLKGYMYKLFSCWQAHVYN